MAVLTAPIRFEGQTVPPLMSDYRKGPDLAFKEGLRELEKTVPFQTSEEGTSILPAGWSEEYTITQDLESGGMANLWLASENSSGAYRVIRSTPCTSQAGYITVDRLSQLGDGTPNQATLVRQYRTILNSADNRIWQILEYCPDGTAHDISVDTWRSSITANGLFIRFLANINEALGFLHSQSLVHADVKPANILVRPDKSFALADLDTCIMANAPKKPLPDRSGHHTPGFTTPDEEYRTESDYFQLGLSLLNLVTGVRRPSEEWSSIDYSAFPQRFQNLLSGLLEADVSARWGYDQVQSWISGGNPDVNTHLQPLAQTHNRSLHIIYASAIYRDPRILADIMSSDWVTARREIRSRSNDQPWLLELAHQIEQLGNSTDADIIRTMQRNLEVSARDGSTEQNNRADEVIAQLIPLLNPDGIPRYCPDGKEAIVLDTEGLNRLANQIMQALDKGDFDDRSIMIASNLMDTDILHPLSQMAGARPGLSDVPDDCRQALDEYKRLIRAALRGKKKAVANHENQSQGTTYGQTYTDFISTRPPEEWECYAALLEDNHLVLPDGERDAAALHEKRIRAQIFMFTVSPAKVPGLRKQADDKLSSVAMNQEWFAALSPHMRGERK